MAVGDRLQAVDHLGIRYSDMEVTDETAANGVRQMARLVKVVDDAGATLNPAAPVLGAGNNNIGDVDVASLPTQARFASVTLTRTNDTNAYTANDVVGAATGSTAALEFTNVGPSAQSVMITSVAFEIDANAIISGETSYTLHLYNVTPPSALGDNAAWDLASNDRASYLGGFSLGTPVDLGSTLWVETHQINKQVRLAGTSLFAYLVTAGAHTPTASRVYVIKLHTVAL